MKRIGAKIITGIMWLLALLPLRVLYFFADILYFFIYYVIWYRRRTVAENLRKSFPEKTRDDLKSIEKQYYHHLTYVIIEFVKIRHINREEITKRMKIRNPEILQELYSEGKCVFVALGHCGNWEWLGQKMATIDGHKPFAIFKPLSNKFFDKHMRKLRARFHAPNLIEFKKTYRTLMQNRHTVNAVIIAADQTPTRGEINYWTVFLNQETPFFLGIEKMAKALDYAVLYFDIRRERKGYYLIDIIPITKKPRETKEYEITEKYVSLLEQTIRDEPYNWLWSHRRWKHKKVPN